MTRFRANPPIPRGGLAARIGRRSVLVAPPLRREGRGRGDRLVAPRGGVLWAGRAPRRGWRYLHALRRRL